MAMKRAPDALGPVPPASGPAPPFHLLAEATAVIVRCSTSPFDPEVLRSPRERPQPTVT
jgi:hypothetical protein